MSLIAKTREIVRLHGLHGLLYRAGRKVRQEAIARRAQRAEKRAWSEIVSRTRTGPVYFPQHANPVVSVIIVAEGDTAQTARCLNALLREMDSLPCEVIVIDDAAGNSTMAYLDECSGLRVIRHAGRQGYGRSANEGARLARGDFLYFCTDATMVAPNWLRPLLAGLESADIGASGPSLRAPDGSIAAAGGIIWQDGSSSDYARGMRSCHPGALFPREVDFCSGASLLVRSTAFREAGTFAVCYTGAAYSAADLSFRLRLQGKRTLYQPDSIVALFQNGVRRSDSDSHEFERNWRKQLEFHFPPGNSDDAAARRISGRRTALVMDAFIPFEDRSAGARRLFTIMQLMRDLQYRVIFVSDDGGEYQPYTSRLRRAGVEVIPHHGDASPVLRALPVTIDVAWLSRADVVAKYLHLLKAQNVPIIYDTVDLHFLRLQRQESLTGRPTQWEAMKSVELSLARSADQTIVTSCEEQRLLQELEVSSLVVPIIEPTIVTRSNYAGRRGILFLGNYTHEPNVDAALWLVEEIMPLVWQHMPTVILTLAGSDPTPAVQRLGGTRVRVPGYIPELRALFEEHRVFAAPLRYGAGMKGKVVQSLAHGLPVVTTTIGAEGVGVVDGKDVFIHDDAVSLARSIETLYNDESTWQVVSNNALVAARRFSRESVRPVLEAALSLPY